MRPVQGVGRCAAAPPSRCRQRLRESATARRKVIDLFLPRFVTDTATTLQHPQSDEESSSSDEEEEAPAAKAKVRVACGAFSAQLLGCLLAKHPTLRHPTPLQHHNRSPLNLHQTTAAARTTAAVRARAGARVRMTRLRPQRHQ